MRIYGLTFVQSGNLKKDTDYFYFQHNYLLIV